MHFDRVQLAVLVVATQWCWIGPALIWYYEKYTLFGFKKYCRQMLAERSEFHDVRREINRNLFSYRMNKFLLVAWMIITTIGFFSARQYLSAFAIDTPFGSNRPLDWLWCVIFAGTLLFGFYTALGFCLSYKAARIVRLVSHKRFKETAYHADKMVGFSQLGSFSFSTNLMFLSGLLFVPMVAVASKSDSGTNYVFIAIMTFLYVAYAAVAVVISIWTVHSKMVRDKEVILKRYGMTLDVVLSKFKGSASERAFREFLVYRDIVVDIRESSDWPLGLDKAAAYFFTIVVLPTVVGFVSAKLASGG